VLEKRIGRVDQQQQRLCLPTGVDGGRWCWSPPTGTKNLYNFLVIKYFIVPEVNLVYFYLYFNLPTKKKKISKFEKI
jgi:hypothetical protein